MDSPHRHTDSFSLHNEQPSDSHLDSSMIQSMPIEDVLKALEQRDLDPQSTLDWVKRKKNGGTKIFYLSLRIAATLLLLVCVSILFSRQNQLPDSPPPIAINPPLGTLYLTVGTEPIIEPANLSLPEAPREEYIVDEVTGPFLDIYERVAPFAKVLGNEPNQPSLEVIAFGDPFKSDSQALYDDLKSLANISSNARIVFVPVTVQSSSKEVGQVLSVLGVESMPAVFVNGNPVML